jgi:hypothetical protein
MHETTGPRRVTTPPRALLQGRKNDERPTREKQPRAVHFGAAEDVPGSPLLQRATQRRQVGAALPGLRRGRVSDPALVAGDAADATPRPSDG